MPSIWTARSCTVLKSCLPVMTSPSSLASVLAFIRATTRCFWNDGFLRYICSTARMMVVLPVPELPIIIRLPTGSPHKCLKMATET